MKDYLFEAIANLTNGARCMIWADDYSTVQWVDFEGTPPTQTEIDAEIVRIKKQEVIDAKNVIKAKADLLAKLGITADEAALLLS
jgi:hypothetical protein